MMVNKKITEEELKLKAENEFYYFVVLMWKYASTRDPFKSNWYVDAICDHLQALKNLEIRNLAICISPRKGKSSLVSVLYPVWRWLDDPKHQFLTGTYKLDLAMRDAVRSRDLIKSNRFQSLWGDRFGLKYDQNEKKRYDNTKGGYRYCMSIGSGATGEGCDSLIIDDPHDAEDYKSPTKLNEVIGVYTNRLNSRFNNLRTSCKLFIHQRIADNDLIGYCLREEKEDWVNLVLEEEYTGKFQYVTPIGWSDPRKEIGELLAPNLLSKEDAVKKKRDPLVWEIQYQQNPAPSGLSVIAKDSVMKYDVDVDISKLEGIAISIDARGGGEEWDSSYFVAQVWGYTGKARYLLDQERHQKDFTEEVKSTQSLFSRYPNFNYCIIEKKANGTALHDSLAVLNEGIYRDRLVLFKPGIYGDKVDRLNTCKEDFDGGYVRIPSYRQFTQGYIEELTKFPRSQFNDQVDATTQFLIWAKLYRLEKLLKNTTSYIKDKEDVIKSDDVSPRKIFDMFYFVDSEQNKIDILQSDRDIRDLFN